MIKKYDIIIIGGGISGYSLANKLSDSNLKILCIDRYSKFGGTCLNVGCVPSKALLYLSEMYQDIIIKTAKYGIDIKAPKFDFNKMAEKVHKDIDVLSGNISEVFKQKKIDSINATASFEDNKTLLLSNGDKVTGDKIIIATGSSVRMVENIKVDGENIITSNHMLNIKKMPKKILIIGAGAISLEMASVFNNLDSDVTICQIDGNILGNIDKDLRKTIERIMTEKKINILLNASLKEYKITKTGSIDVQIEQIVNGKSTILKEKYNKILVAVGRIPKTKLLKLEKTGIKLTKTGHIEVDNSFQTNIKNIYAIGDVTNGPMVAHKAETDANALSEILLGRYGYINYKTVPMVIYTKPALAFIGKTEEQCKEENIDYVTGKSLLAFNSRAQIYNTTEGFVKIIACKKTGKILGCHMICTGADNLISELVLAIEMNATVEDLHLITHPHPTLSESIQSAAYYAMKKTDKYTNK